MLFSFEILDSHLASLNAYLNTQLNAVVDPVTKAQRLEPKFPGGAAEFLTFQIATLIESIVRQFPDDETRAQLQAALDAQNALRARCTPTHLSEEQVAAKLAARGPVG